MGSIERFSPLKPAGRSRSIFRARFMSSYQTKRRKTAPLLTSTCGRAKPLSVTPYRTSPLSAMRKLEPRAILPESVLLSAVWDSRAADALLSPPSATPSCGSCAPCWSSTDRTTPSTKRSHSSEPADTQTAVDHPVHPSVLWCTLHATSCEEVLIDPVITWSQAPI